jgi:hypothetical protein
MFGFMYVDKLYFLLSLMDILMLYILSAVHSSLKLNELNFSLETTYEFFKALEIKIITNITAPLEVQKAKVIKFSVRGPCLLL